MNVDWNRLEHVLESLGLVSRLTENKKLSIHKGKVDIDNRRYLQFLFRGWNSDERNNCLDHVKQVVNEAIHMARASLSEIVYSTNNVNAGGALSTRPIATPFLEKERSLRRYGRLVEAIAAASNGIETQKVTYKNDDSFCSDVDVLMGNIQEALLDMDMTLKMLGNDKGKTNQVQSIVPVLNAPSMVPVLPQAQVSAPMYVPSTAAPTTQVTRPSTVPFTAIAPAPTPLFNGIGNMNQSDDEEINLEF